MTFDEWFEQNETKDSPAGGFTKKEISAIAWDAAIEAAAQGIEERIQSITYESIVKLVALSQAEKIRELQTNSNHERKIKNSLFMFRFDNHAQV